MTVEYTPLIIENSNLSNSTALLRDKVVPWEGLGRSDIITSEQAELVQVLESQSTANRNQTISSNLDLHSRTLLNLLNKLDVNSRDDVLKKVLVLINDLLLELPEQAFIDALLNLSKIDSSLPYDPFLKHLDHSDSLVKTLALYNLAILLTKVAKTDPSSKVDKEILIKIFEILSSSQFIGNSQDSNAQSIGIQILQELVTQKYYKSIYQQHNLVSNFKAINNVISVSAKQPNSFNLQLSYNTLLTTWILSFNAQINKILAHNFPDLIGNLLIIAKDSIKLKIVRIAVSTLKNLIAISVSNAEQFKTIKLLLFHDGLFTIKTLQERKFASNGSDEELSNDLAYLADILNETVTNKLSSLDEYLTELENPELISWSSPTHKSNEFWLQNSGKFKDANYKLVKRLLEIISASSSSSTAKVILLNDLQFLIKNLGQDLVSFVNTEKGGEYKILVMNLLENNNGDNELKYEALKTVQLLVGHNY